MEKKKHKPNLKDTARRARIIAHLKEFMNRWNKANKERIEKGTDEPVTIPITPDGKFREDSHNHSLWGGLDVGISHLPDKVQEDFVNFMVDKGHRVYDERDDISKDPEKQKLGLRAGIVHIDDNVNEQNVDPEKNFVKEKGPGVHEMQEGLYAEEFGEGGDAPSSPGTGRGPYGGGPSRGSTSHTVGGWTPSDRANMHRRNRARMRQGGGGGGSRPQQTDWGKKYREAEAARKKLEEEYSGFKTKVGDYETKYKRLDELESVPFTEQRSQMVRLAAQAKGLAPSAAEKEMKRQSEASLKQNIAFLKSKGQQGAGGVKQFFKTAERMGTMQQQQAGLMKMREKAIAEQGLGGSISEMTGQALKDRWTKMGLNVQTEIAKIQAEAAKYGASLRARSAAAAASAQQTGSMLGAIGSIAGAAIMFSDKKMKKKIKREDLYKNEYGDVYPGYESEEGDSSSYGRHSLSLKERKKQSQDELDKIGFKRIKEARKKSGNKSFQAARVKPKEIETVEKKWGVWDEKGDSKIHKPVKVTPQDLLKKKTKRRKAVKYEKGEPKDFSPKKFLDALKPNSFEYKDKFKKDPLAGEGRFLGVMAQDLEKAGPVGKSMVEDTPMGKLVNYGKGFGAVLAAQAHLNQRLKALESKKKKRK